MKIIDEIDLGLLGRVAVRKHGQQWLNEAVELKNKLVRHNDVTVFLSHKHNDKTHVKDMIALLNDLGVNVYIDWQDYEMPITTDGTTAKLIKKELKNVINLFC